MHHTCAKLFSFEGKKQILYGERKTSQRNPFSLVFHLLCQTPKQSWDFPYKRWLWRFPLAKWLLIMALSDRPTWLFATTTAVATFCNALGTPIRGEQACLCFLGRKAGYDMRSVSKNHHKTNAFQYKWQIHLYYSGNVESPSPTILFVYFCQLAASEHNSKFLIPGMATHPITINSLCTIWIARHVNNLTMV